MTNNHKSDFRISCKERLRFNSLFSKYYKSKLIVRDLKKIINRKNARNILLYIPLDIEVDVKLLIKELRKDRRKNVYVPFIQGDSFKLVKYRLPLYKKKYGIKEPNNSFLKVNKIDLAIIPIVGVDALYKRIGFGAGMYDRFFDRLDYEPIKIFTQLVLCKSDKILSDKYDIQADYIITK